MYTKLRQKSIKCIAQILFRSPEFAVGASLRDKEQGLLDEQQPHHARELPGGQPIEISSTCQVRRVEYG